jgi:hypothetical protein
MSSRTEKLFDKRIVTRNIRKNKLSRKEYEQYLKGLEDSTAKAVPLFVADTEQDRGTTEAHEAAVGNESAEEG